MKVELEPEEILNLIQIVDETYSAILLEKQLFESGQMKGNMQPEAIPDLLFDCATLLLKLNKQAHFAKLCSCPDDSNVILQELLYHKMFASQIKTRDWWKEQYVSHGGFQVASPQSQISAPNSSEGLPKLKRGLDKPRE